MSEETPGRRDLLEQTSRIVSAHVSNNTVAVSDLPDLIRQVYRCPWQASANALRDPPNARFPQFPFAGP